MHVQGGGIMAAARCSHGSDGGDMQFAAKQVLQREGGRSRVAYRALRTEGSWKLQASEALD